jgi:hypothetical protein
LAASKEAFSSTKMTPPSSADGAGTGVAASRILLGPGASSDYPTCHRLQVISATRICATHTHTPANGSS